MHTDLSRHLHSDECNELIELLKNCHNENKFLRLIGQCNDADTAVNRCLKRERLERRSRNFELSKQRKERWRQLDEDARKQKNTSS